MILRKRRHQRERKKETKNGQKFAHKSKKKEKRKKKRADLFLLHSSAQETLYKERERERKHECTREKKKMSENIINKDNNKQMTTRERQHIEVAKLEAELNALKVDAFAKVRVVVVVFSSSSYVGCAF